MQVSVRKHKYGAIPTIVNNIRFDSKREAQVFTELQFMERQGTIHDLERQPRFDLHVDGIKIGYYKADFRFFDTMKDRLVVVDVKGIDMPMSRWKRKHVLAEYGVDVEVWT